MSILATIIPQAVIAFMVFIVLHVFFTIIQFTVTDMITHRRPSMRNNSYFNIAGFIVIILKIIAAVWMSIGLAKL